MILDFKNPDYKAAWQERVDRLARIREPGFDLAALKAFYATRPADFISDWLVTFDPRLPERGLPAIVPFILFPRQRQFVDWLLERWTTRTDGICEKSRDMGVSWLCVGFVVWMMLFKPGTVAGMGSRKELYVDAADNPASLFWKVRQAINLLPTEFRPKDWDPLKDAPHMRVSNKTNGSRIVGEAGDSIGRGNRTSIYIIDEAAFLERQELVDAALSQTCNCRILVSTPNGAGNAFYRKRHGGKFSVFTFDWKDDPRKDNDWYLKMKETLDPVVVAQEIDRSYTASVSNSYVPGDIVTAAQARGPMEVTAMGDLKVGVDPARFGDDKSVITFRQGRMCFPQIIFGKVDLVDCAGRVKDAVKAWPDRVDQIAVDTIGLGAGVADMLRRDFGEIVEDVNSSLRLDDGSNYNLRARVWRDTLDWLKAGASLPTDPELYSDLTALQYSYRGGLLLMESKEDAKKRGIKSPDRADSLALTFAAPVKPRATKQEALHPVWAALDELTSY